MCATQCGRIASQPGRTALTTVFVSTGYRSVFGWLTAIGAAGIVALFLPFTYDYSPLRAMFFDDWAAGAWPLGAPFLLSIPVTLASARLILFGPLSRIERLAAYASSVAAASVIIWWTVTFVSTISSLCPRSCLVTDWVIVALPLTTLAAGGAMLVHLRRNPRWEVANPIMAMQLAYLANALMCFIGFSDTLQVGAFAAVATAVAYVLQVVLIAMAQLHR